MPFRMPAARGPGFSERGVLIDPDQPALLLLAHIARHPGIAHHRHFLRTLLEGGNRIGDEVVVLHIGDRNVGSGHLRHLAGIATGRVDNHSCADRALFGLHIPFAAGQLGQPGDPVLAHDGRAHLLAANRKRVADARGVSVTIIGGPGSGQHAFGGGEGVDLADLFGIDQLHVEADHFRKALDMAQPGQLALVVGKADPARLVPADILPGQPFQLGVEPVRIGVHLGQVEAAGDVRALPGGVPGRAAGQLVLFDQDHVGPAFQGEVVEQACPHDPAPDNHDPCLALH